MNIEIRKLTPELAEDYVNFFDVTPHDVNIDEQKCYCVTWRSDDSYVGDGDHWFPSRKERRDRAIQFVETGSLQGYLAYKGNEIVGWCNANADCQHCINYLRIVLADRERPCGYQGKICILFYDCAESAKNGRGHAIIGTCLPRRSE